MSRQAERPEIGTIAIDGGLTLRRMLVRSDAPKRTALLLHGFPETVHAWTGISLALADDHDVHSFDWPGFGFSSRPPVERFAYAPADYARVLKGYIVAAGIDRTKLTIYATDIGALPALLLALDEPDIARCLIVGDFAPFNRPGLMWQNLQALKSKPSSDHVRAAMNAGRDEILQNTFFRGLPKEAHYDIPQAFRDDVASAWSRDGMTVVDAFYHYYASFTRDQDHFEANLARLTTRVKVVWGSDDLYITKDMGVELAERIRAKLHVLAGVGHYPHLQAPEQTIAEIRAASR
ncbi:alpha/beta hydrolase [Bradyrhizobium sp. CB1717]|uniref:alpha/beta fold hydrolase n=1 Tax=Bradyrhizobium sp. CB1717 TaxID=3039154 RepID=UPI0024B197E8|nr:alpha/beta hydrolase [Bradyrhizobium sp. CB1717]WFU21740.1 alpha/beta hydrolase [Bradyrhizobium sp. CB1717]